MVEQGRLDHGAVARAAGHDLRPERPRPRSGRPCVRPARDRPANRERHGRVDLRPAISTLWRRISPQRRPQPLGVCFVRSGDGSFIPGSFFSGRRVGRCERTLAQRRSTRSGLLGPYAVAAASKECRLKSSKLIDPVVTRHIVPAMSHHGSPTLACRTVMQLTTDIARSRTAGLRRS
jgi:hypothetical protein